MKFLTERLYLRDINESDFVFLNQLECNLQVNRYDSDTIPSIEEVESKYKNLLKLIDENPRKNYCFIVSKSENKVSVGKVTLKILNEAIREWEIGWAFHPDYWGNGYAKESARAVIEFGIRQLNAHRITAFCNAENIPSEKVMKGIGMNRDGYLRQTRMLGGCWKDELVYSFLDNDLK